MTESFMKALAKEQLLPTTWIPAGPNSQLVGLTKNTKVKTEKTLDKIGLKCAILKRLWKKPTLSNFSSLTCTYF